jgi:hypothetical protein
MKNMVDKFLILGLSVFIVSEAYFSIKGKLFKYSFANIFIFISFGIIYEDSYFCGNSFID